MTSPQDTGSGDTVNRDPNEGRFTPGRWAVHPFMAWVSPAADIDTPICQLRRSTDGVGADERVTQADAHLIASAPDLYKALNKLAKLIDDNGEREFYPEVFDALSRARGEQP